METLSALRGSLRQKMERSPMRDFAGFTRGLEDAYRGMWRCWCARQRADGTAPGKFWLLADWRNLSFKWPNWAPRGNWKALIVVRYSWS